MHSVKNAQDYNQNSDGWLHSALLRHVVDEALLPEIWKRSTDTSAISG